MENAAKYLNLEDDLAICISYSDLTDFVISREIGPLSAAISFPTLGLASELVLTRNLCPHRKFNHALFLSSSSGPRPRLSGKFSLIDTFVFRSRNRAGWATAQPRSSGLPPRPQHRTMAIPTFIEEMIRALGRPGLLESGNRYTRHGADGAADLISHSWGLAQAQPRTLQRCGGKRSRREKPGSLPRSEKHDKGSGRGV
jgi:hypothetical protein